MSKNDAARLGLLPAWDSTFWLVSTLPSTAAPMVACHNVSANTSNMLSTNLSFATRRLVGDRAGCWGHPTTTTWRGGSRQRHSRDRWRQHSGSREDSLMMEPLACLIKVLDDNLQNYLASLGFLQLVRLASNSTLQGMVLYMTIILQMSCYTILWRSTTTKTKLAVTDVSPLEWNVTDSIILWWFLRRSQKNVM